MRFNFWVIKRGVLCIPFFYLQKNKILRYITMTVLDPNSEIHELIIIPRNYLSSQTLTVTLRDEQTNLSFTYTPESVTFDFYDLVLISIALPCIYENAFFEMTIRNNLNEIIYKDRLFCTSQNLNIYSINNGVYNELNTNNNDYIVL